GYPVAPYPGSGVAPGQYVPQAGVGGLPIAAIIVSGIAFLIGWMPYIGALLALVGLALSISALRSPRGRVLGIIGTILSGLALVSSVLITLGISSFNFS